VDEKLPCVLGGFGVLLERILQELALGSGGALAMLDDVGGVGEEGGAGHVVDGGGCRIEERLGWVVHVLGEVGIGRERVRNVEGVCVRHG
jgi:hypothetical protein